MAKASNDVEMFRQWCISLGCPPEAIPVDEALKSVFKSQQREVLYTMMKRVRPRQEVEALRISLLSREVEELSGNPHLILVPGPRRAFLPKELQTYFKVQELKKKCAECESLVDNYKKEYDSLSAALKMKNMQIIKAKHKNNALLTKFDLLNLKSASLEAGIKKEETIKLELLKYMPVKINAKNSNNVEAARAVEKALKALDSLYEFVDNNSNPHLMQKAKEDFWSKLRELFFKLPNFAIFNEIMRLKEQQLQYIMELNKKTLADSDHRTKTTKDSMTPFDKELMKAKIDFLALVVKHREAIQERKQIEESFYSHCALFANEFQRKVAEFNKSESEERIEDVISDYLVQLNARAFYKRQNELIQLEINKIRTEIELRAKKLKNHEVLLGTVSQTYNEMNVTMNTVQRNIMQLGQIKDKIMYSRNLLKCKLHDIQVQSSSYESIIIGAENLLCSTQVDMEASMAAPNTSIGIMKRSFAFGDTTLICSAEPRSLLPSHSLELSMFYEIPFEKFSCLERDCAFYVSPNPLVIESREFSSILQLVPGTLLTPHGTLREMCNRVTWADSISSHSLDLKLNLSFDLSIVVIQSYKERNKMQRECLTELLDKIKEKGIWLVHAVQNADKVYNFTLENPLRFYISPTKLFSNRTYAQYEAEFKMYFRMATIGPSKK